MGEGGFSVWTVKAAARRNRRGSIQEIITPESARVAVGLPPRLMEPVIIEVRKKHAYKKKGIKPGNKAASPGCAICDLSQYHRDHIGAPPSLNALGDGNRHKYRDIKTSYEEAIQLALEVSDLPKPLPNGVFVQCQIGFPDRTKRDEGNFRFIPEKSLGDVLQRMGYIPDDNFFPGPALYVFGNIEPVYDKGESWCKMMIFPR